MGGGPSCPFYDIDTAANHNVLGDAANTSWWTSISDLYPNTGQSGYVAAYNADQWLINWGNRFFDPQKYGAWQAMCTDADNIGTVGMTCTRTQYFNGLPCPVKQQTAKASQAMLYAAEAVYQSIENDCGQGTFDTIWPLFYADYNTVDGKAQIEAYIQKTPNLSALGATVLRECSSNENMQRQYQFMNQASRPIIETFDLYQLTWDGAHGSGQLVSDNTPTVTQPGTHALHAGYYWHDYVSPLFPATDEYRQPYAATAPGRAYMNNKATYAETLANQAWQVAAGWHFAIDPNSGEWCDPGFVGNPYWDGPTRDKMVQKAFGFMPKSPYKGNQKPPVTAPGYAGDLPSYQFAFDPGNPLVNSKFVSGGAATRYQDPCAAESPLTEFLPAIVGIVAFVAPMAVFPRVSGTFALSSVLGFTAYSMVKQTYGLAGLGKLMNEDFTDTDRAGAVLAFGAPAALVLIVIQSAPPSWGFQVDNEILVAVGAGVVSEYFLGGIAKLSLRVGGGIFSAISSPLDGITTFLTHLFNGCAGEWFASKNDCLCKDAEAAGANKTFMKNQWLDTYYAVTGDQRRLRNTCLALEMSRGPWASTDPNDPDAISRCNGQVMDNRWACLSAGGWCYGPENFHGVPDRPPGEKEMWDQIYHCLDPDNPSMLPPTAADAPCKQYGEHFRMDPVSGSCKNFIMPGPIGSDPVGLQGPGAMDDPTVGGQKDECTIL